MTTGEPRLTWFDRLIFGDDPDIAERVFGEDLVWVRFKKSRSWYSAKYPQSEIAFCDHCGRLLPKKELRNAGLPDLASTPIDERWKSFMVCIGCLSKFRSVWTRYERFTDLRRLINKLKKAVGDVKKDQDRRRSSPDFIGHDFGRP